MRQMNKWKTYLSNLGNKELEDLMKQHEFLLNLHDLAEQSDPPAPDLKKVSKIYKALLAKLPPETVKKMEEQQEYPFYPRPASAQSLAEVKQQSALELQMQSQWKQFKPGEKGLFCAHRWMGPLESSSEICQYIEDRLDSEGLFLSAIRSGATPVRMQGYDQETYLGGTHNAWAIGKSGGYLGWRTQIESYECENPYKEGDMIPVCDFIDIRIRQMGAVGASLKTGAFVVSKTVEYLVGALFGW